MKKLFILFVFLWGTAPLWGQKTVHFEIKEQEYEIIKDAQDYSVIRYMHETGIVEEVGAPCLPYVVKMYLLPAGATASDVRITELPPVMLEGEFLIAPVQPPVPTGGVHLDTTFVGPNPSLYQSSRPFPSESYSVFVEDIFGYRVAKVVIFPFTYLPAGRKLVKTRLQIQLPQAGLYSVRQPPANPSIVRAELTRGYVASLVENASDLPLYYGHPTLSAARTQSAGGVIPIPASSPVPDYLIITSEALKPEITKLARWKDQKGIKTYIKTVEEIYKTYSGIDKAEKVRFFIKDCVDRWRTGLMVLLAGDVDDVPARTHKSTKYASFHPADTYFANMDMENTWNADGDHLFGNGSRDGAKFEKDIVVGRVPAQTPQQVSAWVNKVLAYEKANLWAVDYSYFNHCLMAAAPITLGNTPFGDNDTDMRNLINFHDASLKNRMQNQFLIDARFTGYSGNATYTNKITGRYKAFNRQNFIDGLNGDSFQPHIVYHMDHGSPTSLNTAGQTLNQGINVTDVGNLTNGPYYQIFISGSCEPGDFSKNCIGERFLFHENGGAVAFIGNTDVGYAGESRRFVRFMDAVDTVPSKSLGMCFNRMFISSDEKWNTHLLGDPEMPVWTDTPKPMNVTVIDTVLSDLSHRLTVLISGLTGTGRICITNERDLYYVDDVHNGMHQYSFDLNRELDVLSIVVTAVGYQPHITRRTFPSGRKHHLSCNRVTIDDSTTGNNDGKADAGESAILKLLIQNVAPPNTYSTIRGTVTCDHASIQLSNEQFTLGALSAWQEKVLSVPFSVDPQAAQLLMSDPEAVTFRFDIEDGNTGTKFTFADVQMDLLAPELKMELAGISGLPIAGQPITVQLRVTNAQLGQARGLTANVSGDFLRNPYTGSLGNLDYGNDLVHSIPLQVDNSYTGGTDSLYVTVTNQYGRSWKQTFNLVNAPVAMNASDFKYECDRDWIQVYWPVRSGIKGYNIYRCDVNANQQPTGTYRKQNRELLTYPFYQDIAVNRVSSYFYKVTVVSADGIESPLSDAFLASTSLARYGNFPILPYYEGGRVDMPVMTGDIHGDGKLAIFTGVQYLKGDKGKGAMLGFDYQGVDLFDLDNNVTTPSGFATTSYDLMAACAIAPLRRGQKKRLFFADRGQGAGTQVHCYALEDADGDGKPDLIWKTDLRSSCLRSVIVANLDGSADGSQEIILRGEANSPSGYRTINVLSERGEPLYSFGESNTYSTLAVADLNRNGEKEIIAGTREGKVIAYRYNGDVFRTFINEPAITFRSTPIVCDLDNDGTKEILIVGRDARRNYVYARKADGRTVPGWNDRIQSFSHPDDDLDFPLAVGDLDNDGKLEVVTLGKDSIYIWKNNGTLLNRIYVRDLVKHRPILADVDGNPGAEIIVTVGRAVYAFDISGNQIVGFPLQTGGEIIVGSSPTVADVDDDGFSEILVTEKHSIHAWRTLGNPDDIHWGQAYHNNQNTNEYKWPALTTRTNTLWAQPINPRGDVVVKKGTLTLSANCTLTLAAEATIIVENGATLCINGAVLRNADIEVRKGGTLQLQSNSQITLRKRGGVFIEVGGFLEGSTHSIQFSTQ